MLPSPGRAAACKSLRALISVSPPDSCIRIQRDRATRWRRQRVSLPVAQRKGGEEGFLSEYRLTYILVAGHLCGKEVLAVLVVK